MTIIASLNCGALNQYTSRQILNLLLKVENLKKRPDTMLIQETGKDENLSDFRELHFGFANARSSEENDSDGLLVDKSKQRHTKTFCKADSTFHTLLNTYPEIVCMAEELKIKRNGGRLITVQLLIVNAYRNHETPIPTFKGWLLDIINTAKSVFNLQEIIIAGDMNTSNLNLPGLFEVPHAGTHCHRKGKRHSHIDKIFVSKRILDAGVEVVVLKSVEKIAEKDAELGHKCLITYIGEKLNQLESKKIIKHSLFLNNIRSKFTDNMVRILRRDMSIAPMTRNQYIPDNTFSCQKMDEYLSNHDDPAALLTNKIIEVIQDSYITIKNKAPLMLEDVENFMDNSSDSVKKFCRFYNHILNTFCTIDPAITAANDDSRGRPPLMDLCKTLSKKLNGCHLAEQETIERFVSTGYIEPNEMSLPKKTITKLTMEDLNTAIRKIRQTKTPWFCGISPHLIISAMKKSENLKKCVLDVCNRCVEAGRLCESMNHDAVLFLHKKDKIDNPSNYRPISIDNVLTKILCQLINTKIMGSLRCYINPNNFSYEPNKSTFTAILSAALIIDEIRERKNLAIVICTDMKGAFENTQSNLIEACLEQRIQDTDKVKMGELLVNYMRQKVIFGRDESGIYEVYRENKNIGAGQGSKISPNLFLIQASLATHTMGRMAHVFMFRVGALGISLLVYADDNFSIVEIIDDDTFKDHALYKTRQVTNAFMELWEEVIKSSGLIINDTKTEILAPHGAVSTDYPPIKKHIKWLGINLCLNKDHKLKCDTDENMNMIRRKTWPKFSQMLHLTPDLQTKRAIFNLFIEPIIDYCAVDMILSDKKKFKPTLQRYQTLQNDFLRRLTGLGNYVRIEELHENLGVHSVEYKSNRLAANEWEKVSKTKDYTPAYKELRTGKQLIIRSLMDHFYQMKLSHPIKKVERKFDQTKFDTWHKEQIKKRDAINSAKSAKEKYEAFIKRCQLQMYENS